MTPTIATIRGRAIRTAFTILAAGAAVLAPASPSHAWDAAGHRLITLLALDHLSPQMPEFLKQSDTRTRITENALEPDRWRSVRLGQLVHLNNPDHYLDVEDLEAYGLTLRDIAPLRYEFISQLVLARERAGENFKGRPINPARDTAKTDQWPGFAPYAAAENYGKLISSFKVLRILEKLADSSRQEQVLAERGNVVAIMGVLSHYVGDLAQPLHTTHHHHGWQGDNPEGFTTRYTFHSYIDGGVLDIHALTYESLKDAHVIDRPVETMNPWSAIIEHVERSHAEVVPLYQLDKSGELTKEPGKVLISGRLVDGASMLAALYNAAWQAAEPTEKDIENFQKYDGFVPPPAVNTPPAAVK
ncbi:MAG: hypothetical protein IT435_01220 [Phycisphaerales bacterium]|nr:hypothetical protein [Phycisphaerales bacterium]